MINKIQVTIDNVFVKSCDKNSDDLGISAFNRSFNKLVNENKCIGNIAPFYIKIGDTYRILGVFAFSHSGAISFFPELPGYFFDHITFGKNLNNNNAHLTDIIEDGRKKISPVLMEELTNKTLHVITFIFKDVSSLKLAPREVIFPPVDIASIDALKEAIYINGKPSGSGMLEIDSINEGSLIIQFFVIPNGVDFKSMTFYPIKTHTSIDDFDIELLKKIKVGNAILKNAFQENYKIGILGFIYQKQVMKEPGPYLGYSVDRNGLYFNPQDTRLRGMLSDIIKKRKKSS